MQTHRFTQSSSAKEFIEDLINLQSSWQHPNRSIFIWRGVGDGENHKLVPTALRDSNRERLLLNASILPGSIFYDMTPDEQQCYLEFRILERFLAIADYSGLSLPELPFSSKAVFDEYAGELRHQQFSEIMKTWVPRELIPVLSLVQHYGLPTRLLDWTYSPIIAAYFAADSAIREMRKNPDINPDHQSLAVWVASVHDLAEAKLSVSGDDAINLGVEVASPPNHQNPNLAAQEGVFTWTTGTESRTLKWAKRPLDEVANLILNTNRNLLVERVGSFGLSQLSWRHAEELLVRLYQLGVSRATLMPGYAGVARCLEELGASSWTPGRNRDDEG